MTVSNIVRLGTGNLTPQQLADMALEADREARRLAKQRGRLPEAIDAAAERDKLAALSIAKVFA